MNKPLPLTPETIQAIFTSVVDPIFASRVRFTTDKFAHEVFVEAIVAERDAQWEQMLSNQEPVAVVVPIDGHKENVPTNRMVSMLGEMPDVGTKLYSTSQPEQEQEPAAQSVASWEIEEDDFGDDVWFGGVGQGQLYVNGGWVNGGYKNEQPERWAQLQAEARLMAIAPELMAFVKEVQRSGDVKLASMAQSLITKAATLPIKEKVWNYD